MECIGVRGLRSLWKSAGVFATALVLCACQSGAGENEAAVAEPTPETHDGRALPTGGDYHSTSFRAQGRTLNRLDGIQAVREEQKQEELGFSSPGGATQP